MIIIIMMITIVVVVVVVVVVVMMMLTIMIMIIMIMTHTHWHESHRHLAKMTLANVLLVWMLKEKELRSGVESSWRARMPSGERKIVPALSHLQ